MRKQGIKRGMMAVLAGVLLVNQMSVSVLGSRAKAAEAGSKAVDKTVDKTREEAAVWVAKEMEKRGEAVQEELLEKIKAEKRISDLRQIKKKNREAVLLAYHWGIIAGFRNGAYSTSRSFKGSQKITQQEWEEIKQRVKKPKQRLKLSPDGQLCRTTGLPSNSKKFPYILDSYPNSYYEGTFDYEWYEGTLKAGKDYINPSEMGKAKFTNWKASYPLEEIRKKNEDAWKQCIQRNLETRLNVDYRKASDYQWLNALRNTYFLYDEPQQDLKMTREIEAYLEKIKKNQVVIKGSVDLDSSSLYKSVEGYFMRAHIKFQVISAKQMPTKQTELLFGEHISFQNLKKGVWKEAIVDIGLGSANPYSDGSDFAVVVDNLVERK